MRKSQALLLFIVIIVLVGCPGIRPTRFVNPDFNFSFVEKVAVLSFENFSGDQQSGVRATRLLITELLSSGAVDVLEPGEVQAAFNRLPGAGNPPSAEQIVTLGKDLGVQAVILGSINQSETVRSGTVSIPVVTIDVHMVETETGSTVWAVTHTEKGGGFGARFLGTGNEPISQTTRRCVRRIVKKLVG